MKIVVNLANQAHHDQPLNVECDTSSTVPEEFEAMWMVSLIRASSDGIKHVI